MSSTTPALIAAAAAVAFGHAILPDHWVPLAVVGRARRYPLTRVARISGLAGLTHVLVSLLLGGVVIVIGLQLQGSLESAQSTIVGCVLIATGLGFAAFELSGRGHAHGDRAHGHSHDHGGAEDDHRDERGLHGLAGIMVPFGAAASPDLTILPVFLAASTAGVGTAVGSLVAFAAVTVGTIVALTVLATVGGYRVRGRWLDRWGNAITAATLMVVGALVLLGLV